MFAKLKQKHRAGQLYEGLATYTDDPQMVPRPGFYALSADGKRVLADVPLVCVDDAPGDDDDGACHYEYAGPKDYPQRRADGTKIERRGVVVMEAETHGNSGVGA